MSIVNDEIIIIEPFYGGSHKQLIDVLTTHFHEIGIRSSLVTLPSTKWHWRARCGALQIYDKIPKVSNEKVLWCSSVLNLAELLGLRPDLHSLKKIVYFHENQLIYPVQHLKDRDVQYAYNQVTTCLSADIVLFNSEFNMTSFLDNLPKLTNMLPDHRPKNLRPFLAQKCKVLYFPVSFPELPLHGIVEKPMTILQIAWPHRWEFDKGPEDFFQVMMRLKSENVSFRLFVLGESYSDVPEVFEIARHDLAEEIVNFGFAESREDYFRILCSCHVAVSTAKHEFFGVSMLEASYCGCLPLVPKSLVYPEIYPTSCQYSNLDTLYERLKSLCLNPHKAVELRDSCDIDFSKYSRDVLLPKYVEIISNTV